MSEARQNLFSDRSTVLENEIKFDLKYSQINNVCLLEMYPSFPYRKRGHIHAWF